MNSIRQIALVAMSLGLATLASGQTTINSANGYPWDLEYDSGAVDDGGNDAFDGYGYLVGVQVKDTNSTVLGQANYLSDFNLTLNGRTLSTTAPMVVGGVSISRQIFAPSTTNYLRYFDTFTNTTGATVTLKVAFGGDLGSDSATTLAATSSGALTLSLADYWAVTIQNNALNAAGGPQGDPPVGVLFGNRNLLSFGSTNSEADIFSSGSAWTGDGDDGLSYVFGLTLAPGQSSSLMYFLYRGQSESGNGSEGETGGLAFGTNQVALASTTLANLAANPDLTGLTPTQIAQVTNVAAVPEPSTWALLVLGGVTLLTAARRRRA